MTVKTKRKIGLAKFVREVSPHLHPGTGKKTPRALYQCTKCKSTFTAVLSDTDTKRCNSCNPDVFGLDDMMKIKMLMQHIARAVEPPSFSMSLTRMVERQNLRTEFSNIGHEISKMPPQKLRTFAEGGGTYSRNIDGMVSKVLFQAAKLYENGAETEAEQVRAELVKTLIHEQ